MDFNIIKFLLLKTKKSYINLPKESILGEQTPPEVFVAFHVWEIAC